MPPSFYPSANSRRIANMTNLNHIVSLQSDHVLVEEPAGFEVIWEEQKSRLNEIAAVCAEGDTNKVLILGPETKVHLSVIELLLLAKGIAKLDLRVALVVNTDLSSELESFFKDIASNRGSPMQFFKTEKDAGDWLNI
jgi:hypothetical protein